MGGGESLMAKHSQRPSVPVAVIQVTVYVWPMMLAVWLGIFTITLLEVLISTWEGRADRKSTTAKTMRYSVIAANWAVAFEIVLFMDLWILVKEGLPILIPISAGAWIGKFWALEHRRRNFRPRPRRLRNNRAGSKVDLSPTGGIGAPDGAGSPQQSSK